MAFLDIKGAFDYIIKALFLKILQRLNLPRNVVSWVDSFMTDRWIQLAFEGKVQNLIKVLVGLP